jgi:hypothetical protein
MIQTQLRQWFANINECKPRRFIRMAFRRSAVRSRLSPLENQRFYIIASPIVGFTGPIALHI